jgi:glycogen phosphorylase
MQSPISKTTIYLTANNKYNGFIMAQKQHIAYFSMEIGLDSRIKTYAGGLGILAGDTLKSADDMGINVVGVSLLYKYGYFKQTLDKETGTQNEEADIWEPNQLLQTNYDTIQLDLFDTQVNIKVWEYRLNNGNKVLFLDTDLEQNSTEIRAITNNLYEADDLIRLKQEILLGLGGVLLLDKLGYDIRKYHLNESHAGFGVLPLLDKYDLERVKEMIVFTTHTPVLHGHRGYTIQTLQSYLPARYLDFIPTEIISNDYVLLTDICLYYSGFNNGVSKKHAQVSKVLFPNSKFAAITNGIHTYSWTSQSIQKLFDKYLTGWRSDPFELRHAQKIPTIEILHAHLENKLALLDYISQTTNKSFDKNILTIGFGRRADSYKRNNLVFQDIQRLRQIASKYDGIQFVFAGKSYPDIEENEQMIREIYSHSLNLNEAFRVVYLENYDMEIAKLMVSGCDVWLNTPKKTMEASGTSGMKAAVNGVPSLSVLDGWWEEGCIEGVTGWSIGSVCQDGQDPNCELTDIYDTLEYKILPLYTLDRLEWVKIMQQSMAINGGYFHTHRMLQEYITKAYL